jgi:hypothetical protein
MVSPKAKSEGEMERDGSLGHRRVSLGEQYLSDLSEK